MTLHGRNGYLDHGSRLTLRLKHTHGFSTSGSQASKGIVFWLETKHTPLTSHTCHVFVHTILPDTVVHVDTTYTIKLADSSGEKEYTGAFRFDHECDKLVLTPGYIDVGAHVQGTISIVHIQYAEATAASCTEIRAQTSARFKVT
ncbi:hypothetical protein SARC_09430 [Sphaeroforma arctica JP610]|uniref:Uncharacterized protein n=1 Tax=Sphaeroforma arctica JP610 TaxID=667725 RepID=A0A0L0FQ66_9EUKA|nr:hypothetical protein SARC_09430 [Sphaeroforma arctica JP610]KNC78123.1 hypothetical protein SARC_09430 [Sphaeroforma arctica JP610]|eukprot:XP_014152025.1 hypothetical protein SARC_09430 [Sphaeroforma arctica JP610]